MNREMLKRGGMLFLFFVKIGCFSFGGGWSILAQMEQEFVVRRQWITKSDLVELTAVGKSVPGIMITNISMLFGYQMAGWFGGICCVVGITLPAMAILSVVALFYNALKDNYWCSAALRGITCMVVPIIAGAAISLGKEVFRQRSGIVICAVALALITLAGISNVVLVLLGVAAALIWMGVKRHDPD